MENTCEAGTKSNIQSEINVTRNSVTALEEIVGELIKRIEPILKAPPEKGGEPSPKQPDRPRCQLDSAVHELAERTAEQVKILRRMVRDLQI